MQTVQILALAMLLGSIPFGDMFSGIRVRRGASTELADWEILLVGFLDAMKAFVPVYLAQRYLESPIIVMTAAVIATLSNCFPYWLLFKRRGRGFPSSLGILLALNPLAGAGAFVLWIAAVFLSGYISAATMAAAVSAPIMLKLLGAPKAYVVFALIGCAYVIVASSSDISRLLNGSEPKLNKRAE